MSTSGCRRRPYAIPVHLRRLDRSWYDLDGAGRRSFFVATTLFDLTKYTKSLQYWHGDKSSSSTSQDENMGIFDLKK